MKFYQAMYEANLLYGISFTNEDDFAEIALIGWDKIGNKNTFLQVYRATIDPLTNSVELPCNCDLIEAVTYDGEDYNEVTPYSSSGDGNSKLIEEYIESRKHNTSSLYISGRYAKYQRKGNTLYFDTNYGNVNILFHGILLDENELPELNSKEVSALATYVAYVQTFKEAISTNNQAKMQLSQILLQKWQQQCDNARTPEHITQNEMNQILEVKTSHNRKQHGKSYKPIR